MGAIRAEEKRLAFGLVALVILVGALLRLSGLGEESFWADEVSSLVIAGTGSFASVAAASWTDVHPPLYYFLLKIWLAAVPSSEAGARLLSALSGIGAVFATFVWGRLLRLPWRACLLGAGLMALNPHAIWYAQETRMYALETLLGTLHLAAAARLFSLPAQPSWPVRGMKGARGIAALWLVSGTALLWTHFFGVFFLLADCVWALMIYRRVRRAGARGVDPGGPLLALAWGAVFWAATSWPLLIQVISRMRGALVWISGGYRLTWGTPLEIVVSVVAGPLIAAGPGWLRVAGVVGFVALVAAGLALRPRGSGPRLAFAIPFAVLICVLVTPLLVSIWKVITLGGVKQPTLATTALSLAAGIGLHALLNGRWHARLLAVASALAVAALQVAYLSQYYRTREKQMWREAVAFAVAEAAPGDAAVVIPAPKEHMVTWYSRGGLRLVRMPELLGGAEKSPRLWVFNGYYQRVPDEDRLAAAGWRKEKEVEVQRDWPSTLVWVSLYRREQ